MQTGSTNSTENQWIHVTVSVDKANNNVKFYQNGNLINTFSDVPIIMNSTIGKNNSSLKAKMWRLRVLSLTQGANTSHKITPGDSLATSTTTHMGVLRTTEIALSESDGIFIQPSHIKVCNSEGDTIDPAPTMQNDVYNANQFNSEYTGLLQEYINIDYTFSEEKQIEEVDIGTTGDPQNGGFPVDMELYYSLDEGDTWLKQGGFTYNTGDLKDVDNNQVTLSMYHGNAKHIIKYKADENRWYFDKVEDGNGSKTDVNYNSYTYPVLVDNPVPPEENPNNRNLGSLESMLVGSSIMTNKAFKGHLDDVTIHEDTLTDEQVTAVYNASYSSYIPTIPLNQWSHIVVNHNKYNKKLDMYLNGSLCGTYDNFEGNIVDNDNDLKFGENLSGEISETVLFKRPLINTEINALATNTKRHEKNKELVCFNFVAINEISLNSIKNNSAEDDLTLSNSVSFDAGHTNGAKALNFNGSQIGLLNLSESFVFDNIVLEANVKLNIATGSQQSIVKVDGSFNWFIDSDGKQRLTMDGDITQYKMDNVLKDNTFANLELKVDKFNKKISFTNKSEKPNGWVLVHRDINGQVLPDNIDNVGSLPDDFNNIYSILGDMMNNTGEMTNENIKSSGQYRFRLIPYLSGEERLLPDNTERYLDWTQVSNPTTTYSEVTNYKLVDFQGEVYTQELTTDTSTYFGGLSLAHTSREDNFWLNGNPGQANFWYQIGLTEPNVDYINTIYFAYNGMYQKVDKIELYVWKGEPEIIKNSLPNFVQSLTLPVSYTTSIQRSTIDITLYNGTKQTMDVTTDTETDAHIHKTPWILALNYIHKGDTNPALNVRDISKGLPVLPIDGTSDYENIDINGVVDDGSYNPDSWGHTGNDLFNKLCEALGSETGNDNGVEVRVVSKSGKPGNDRLINFKSGNNKIIKDFRYGNEDQEVFRISDSNKFSDFTLLDGHTAYIPDADIVSLFEGVGDNAMTSFGSVSISEGNHHFYIGEGGRWEADDTNSGSTNNTYHQIWVRAYNDKEIINKIITEIEDVTINMNTGTTLNVGENLIGSISELNVGLGFYIPKLVNYQKTKEIMNFSFDESTTDLVIDTSELSNNGTMMNGATRKYGTYDIQSKGVKLDASLNQYVDIPGAAYANYNFSTSTMSAWVFTTSGGSILKRTGLFDLRIENGLIKFIDEITYENVTSSITIENDIWTHIAVVLDEFEQKIGFYKNGVIVDTLTSVLPINIPFSSTNIIIGKDFTGVMDNVIIHLGKLNLTNALSLYSIPDILYNPIRIINNEWTHIVASYHKESNSISMYQNGEPIGYYNNYLKNFADIGTNNNNMYIATTGDNTTFYDGIVDDIRIYKTKLTDDDILDMYKQYRFHKRYFDIENSISKSSFQIGNISLSEVIINEPEGKSTNNIILYYAFPITRSLNGKSEVQFLIDNIDSLSNNLYTTISYTTTGIANTQLWNPKLTKVISGNLTEEADLTNKLSVYVYLVAQDYEGNIDYIYKQIPRTFPPISLSLESQITEANSDRITLTEGNVISVKQYFVFAFKGQISLEEAKLFTQNKLLTNVTTNTGGTTNTINGHDVYSYKTSGALPTNTGHLIEAGITLSNAFEKTTDTSTTPVTISLSELFTTYMVAIDVTNRYYVITSGGSITDLSHLPKAKYWRTVYGGPFFDRDGDQVTTAAAEVYHGLEVMHSGITDLTQLTAGGKLPDVSSDSKSVSITISTTGTNYTEMTSPTYSSTIWKHNDTSLIAHAHNGPAYNYDGTDANNKGGIIQYEFQEEIFMNEVIYSHVVYDTANWGNNFFTNPTYVSIEYSTNGTEWTREHQYVRGTDLNGNLTHHTGTGSSTNADVMFLQRDINTGLWKPGVIKENLNGHAGSPDVFPTELSSKTPSLKHTPRYNEVNYYRILMGDFSENMTNGSINKAFNSPADFDNVNGLVRLGQNMETHITDINIVRTSDDTVIENSSSLVDSDNTQNKMVISSFRLGTEGITNWTSPGSGFQLGTQGGRGEWIILKLEENAGDKVKIEIIEQYGSHMNSHFHIQKWIGGEIPSAWTVANNNTSTYSYINEHIWNPDRLNDKSFDVNTIQYNLPEGPNSGWVDVAKVPRIGPDDYEFTLATSSEGTVDMKKMTSTEFTLLEDMNIHVSVPFSINFEFNEATNSGLELSLGEMIVGTSKSVSKITMFAFDFINTGILDEQEVMTFYNQYLNNISISSDEIYVNTNGFDIQQVVDLSTLNISLTKSFNNSNTNSTTQIVEDGDYLIYSVIQDINNKLIINNISKDRSINVSLPNNIYTHNSVDNYNVYTPIDDLSLTIPTTGIHQVTFKLLATKTNEDGGYYKHSGNVMFETSEDNGVTWNDIETSLKGYYSRSIQTTTLNEHGRTNVMSLIYQSSTENTMIRPKIKLINHGGTHYGWSYWFGYILTEGTNMSSLQLPDNVKMIELYKNNPSNISSTPYTLTWSSTSPESINTATDIFYVNNNNSLCIKDNGKYLFIVEQLFKNKLGNGHNFDLEIYIDKDDVMMEKTVKKNTNHNIGSTIGSVSSIFIDNVTAETEYKLKLKSPYATIVSNSTTLRCIKLDECFSHYCQCLTSIDQDIPLTYNLSSNNTSVSEWIIDTSISSSGFSIDSNTSDININASGYYTIYLNLFGSINSRYTVYDLYINGIQQNLDKNENFNSETFTTVFNGINLNKNDKVSIRLHNIDHPSQSNTTPCTIKTNSSLVIVSHY